MWEGDYVFTFGYDGEDIVWTFVCRQEDYYLGYVRMQYDKDEYSF